MTARLQQVNINAENRSEKVAGMEETLLFKGSKRAVAARGRKKR